MKCHFKTVHIFSQHSNCYDKRVLFKGSDRYVNDSKFVENLREYKGYMITSVYEEKVIDKEFGKPTQVSRKDTLYKKGRKIEKRKQENTDLLQLMNRLFLT